MEIEIGAKQVFYLRLNEDIVQMLMALSATHYDGDCKRASQHGGLLFGWQNHMEFARETRETPVSMVNCSNRELQLALKICENFMALPEAQAQARREFTKWGYAALEQATEDPRFKQLVPVVVR